MVAAKAEERRVGLASTLAKRFIPECTRELYDACGRPRPGGGTSARIAYQCDDHAVLRAFSMQLVRFTGCLTCFQSTSVVLTTCQPRAAVGGEGASRALRRPHCFRVSFRWRAQSPVVDSKGQTVFAATRYEVRDGDGGPRRYSLNRECSQFGCVPHLAPPDAPSRARGHEGSRS